MMMMKNFRSFALLCMITCGYSWTTVFNQWSFDDLRNDANTYLNKVEFSNAAGQVLSKKTYNTIPYGDMDHKQVKASDVSTGQPIDPAMMELLTDTNLSGTYNGFSDGHYYGKCCYRVLELMTVGKQYATMVEGSGWHNTAWIAGCQNAKTNEVYNKGRQNEDKFMSNHMLSNGSFDAEKNALPVSALNDAQNVKLKSITAWQRPLLAGNWKLDAARKSINSWAWTPVWNTFMHTFSFTNDMKYAVRDVMEHWFLVCKFEYNGEDIYVRIERVQTGILVTRCEQAEVSVGASFDSATCGSGELGAQKISDTHGKQYATDSPANDDVSLEDVLNFCIGEEGNKYKMFFNNCRQFAKHAFDKFTSRELYIPSLDKGFYELNGYGNAGNNAY